MGGREVELMHCSRCGVVRIKTWLAVGPRVEQRSMACGAAMQKPMSIKSRTCARPTSPDLRAVTGTRSNSADAASRLDTALAWARRAHARTVALQRAPLRETVRLGALGRVPAWTRAGKANAGNRRRSGGDATVGRRVPPRASGGCHQYYMPAAPFPKREPTAKTYIL